MPLNPPISSHNKKAVTKIAEEAFLYTTDKIKHSSIFLSAKELETPKGEEISRIINLMREEIIPGDLYSREWIEGVAANAEKYALGNCCERACFAFNFLLNHIKEPIQIELFNNPFQDHFFVVIGRSELTNPADPRTWNKDTIICDALNEDRCYTLADVNFDDLGACNYSVILGLSNSTNTLTLQKAILAKANGHLTGPRIILQDRLVLRSSANPPLGQFTTHNPEVQMCYEAWDFPKKRDYKKQILQDQTSARSLCHGTVSFYQHTSVEVPVPPTQPSIKSK